MLDETNQVSVCTIRFDEGEDPEEKLHGNIPADSNKLSLNQFCSNNFILASKLTHYDEIGCMPYDFQPCAHDDGTCIHNHQERDVKSYVRCGVTRPLVSFLSATFLELKTY